MSQEAKGKFWERQFSEEILPGQIWFDVIFGIIAPILCLVFDPIVFQGGILGGPAYLHNIRIFAYLSIGLGIVILAIWLSLKQMPRSLIGAISGVFFAGSILALALGVVLLPISIIGLMFVIGILGFAPFLTAFVFLRNGIRSLRKIQSDMHKGLLIGLMLLGIIITIGIPLAINWKTSDFVSQSIQTIIHSENEHEANLAIDNLKSAFWCSDSCYDEIVWAYEKEDDEEKRQILAKAYFRLTGKNIEQRLWRLND